MSLLLRYTYALYWDFFMIKLVHIQILTTSFLHLGCIDVVWILFMSEPLTMLLSIEQCLFHPVG